MKYVIVGGVAGGAAVAARIRRNDEKAEIIIFEKGHYISYANCGLPYYVGEIIKEREKLFVETPESFKSNLNIDVKIDHEVLSIDKDNKRVKVQNLNNSDIFSESYDKLILSPGATPIIPPIKGVESSKVFTLRNVPDADRIKEYIDIRRPTSAIVVGAGFIGMEAAENLYDRGLNVSIVEMANQVMAPLDFEMASQVHEHLKYKGVALYLSDGVKEIRELENRVEVILNSGRSLYTDLVVLSIGVKPLTVLAESAGLRVDRGIVVNSKMETSCSDIYALGDAAQINNGITGNSTIVPLAGPAGKQARILADNLVYNSNREYRGAIGTSIAKIFDMTVATTGLPEKNFKDDVLSVIVNGSSHAGYYPGAMQLYLKLVFNSDGKILGAQGVGFDGVDKRIELIAAAIKLGGNVTSLTEIEHAYAPPFSSSKDPVNILGFTAENVLLKRSHHSKWYELRDLLSSNSDYTLLDIRTSDERELHPFRNTLNIAKDEIRDSLINGELAKIKREGKIVILCSGGLRAYLTERILKQNDFSNVSILSGGLNVFFSAIKDQNNIVEFSNRSPERETPKIESSSNYIEVDACGLQCPGPILKLKEEVNRIKSDEILKVTASDPGFYKDVTSWCNMTGNKILGLNQEHGKVVALVQKTLADRRESDGIKVVESGNELTIICFSDDMDKALASMVIANGAAASGKKVTVFFTFWGLSIIKKRKKAKVKKGFMGKMFGLMLPSNLNKLALSKMNMGGIGAFMMKGIMNSLKIDNLQKMQDTLIGQGAKLIACQMSMDVMGVKKEELIDEVEIGGVANYLEAASTSNINLFI